MAASQGSPDLVKSSKALSWLLRHGAAKEGLTISSEGWVKVDDILKKKSFKTLDKSFIEKIVNNCPKKRFALKVENEALYIRANQGHTMTDINPDLETITDPDELITVIHGTYFHCWNSIKSNGLSKMKRQHIHFASGLPGLTIKALANCCAYKFGVRYY